MSLGVKVFNNELSIKADSYQILNEVCAIVPANIRGILSGLLTSHLNLLEEIRLRQGRPLMVKLSSCDRFISSRGQFIEEMDKAYQVTPEDLSRSVQLLTNSSIYAMEEELKGGYITVPGGHRVGVAGRVVMENGQIKTLKHISALNIRVARQVFGAADKFLPLIINKTSKELYHTLIASPPGCGKTTILRDMIRQISFGVSRLGYKGSSVGLVDERSELAACYRGLPQMDVGPRTDVLDGCPKAEGMMMLIRSMGPQVIAVDEVGRGEDLLALEEALNAGIKVMATVHGSCISDLLKRPGLAELINQGIFERIIFLDRRGGPGNLKEVVEGATLKALISCH